MKSILSIIQRINILVFIGTIISGFVLFATSDDFVLLKVKFKSCPYNHYDLKAVPISYGFILPDSNYINKIKNFEIYPGGCTITSKSAKYKVVCKECGFILEETDSIDYWHRVEDSNKGFEIPLNSVIANTPIINLVTLYDSKFLSYSQMFENNKVVGEVISYASKSSVNNLNKKFLEYLHKNGIDFKETTLTEKKDSLESELFNSYHFIKTDKIFRLSFYSSFDSAFIDVILEWDLTNI